MARLFVCLLLLLCPLSSFSAPEVFVTDTLDESSCLSPHFLLNLYPVQYEHTISALNTDSLLDSLAFTILVQSDNPDFPLSLIELEVLLSQRRYARSLSPGCGKAGLFRIL